MDGVSGREHSSIAGAPSTIKAVLALARRRNPDAVRIADLSRSRTESQAIPGRDPPDASKHGLLQRGNEQFPRTGGYSERNDSTGLTRAARHAGITEAAIPAPSKETAATLKLTGSAGET